MRAYEVQLIRQQVGLTQVQMAARLGLSLSHWRNIERGRQEAGALVRRVLLLLSDGIIRAEDLVDDRPYVPDAEFVSTRSNNGLSVQ